MAGPAQDPNQLSEDELSGLHKFLLDQGADPYEVDSHMQAIRSKYGPGQGRTPQDPAIGEGMFTDAERTAASFGNAQGVAPMLSAKGYKNPRVLDGEFEAQGPTGTWVRDQSNFFRREKGPKGYIPEHPVNWAESRLGHLLPEAGKTIGQVGGALGVGATVPETFGASLAAAPVAAAAAGAAGGYAGEGVRQYIGDALGTYRGDGMPDAADQALEGAVGGLVGELPIPGAGKLLKGKAGPIFATTNDLAQAGINRGMDFGKKAIAKGAAGLSGLSSESIETLLNMPKKVWQMGDDGASSKLAKSGQDEVLSKIRGLGKSVEYANRGLNDAMGNHPVDPDAMQLLVERAQDLLRPYRPGGAFAGKMDAHELQELDDMIASNFYRDLPPGATPPAGIPKPLLRSRQVGTKDIPSSLGNYYQSGEPILQHSVPGSNVEKLQAVANITGRDVGGAWDRNPIGPTRSDAATGVRQKLYGLTKGELHDIDPGPQGLEGADQLFHEARDQGKLISPLNNEKGQSKFVEGLAKLPSDTPQRQASKSLAPNMDADLPALKAALEFAQKNTKRNSFMGGAGALYAMGEHAQNPYLKTPALAAFVAGGLGHPKLIENGLGGISHFGTPLWSLLRSRMGAQGAINLGVPTGLDELAETLKNQK